RQRKPWAARSAATASHSRESTRAPCTKTTGGWAESFGPDSRYSTVAEGRVTVGIGVILSRRRLQTLSMEVTYSLYESQPPAPAVSGGAHRGHACEPARSIAKAFLCQRFYRRVDPVHRRGCGGDPRRAVSPVRRQDGTVRGGLRGDLGRAGGRHRRAAR